MLLYWSHTTSLPLGFIASFLWVLIDSFQLISGYCYKKWRINMWPSKSRSNSMVKELWIVWYEYQIWDFDHTHRPCVCEWFNVTFVLNLNIFSPDTFLPSVHAFRFPSPRCWPCCVCGSGSPCPWSTWATTLASANSPTITQCAPTRSLGRFLTSAGTWTSL